MNRDLVREALLAAEQGIDYKDGCDVGLLMYIRQLLVRALDDDQSDQGEEQVYIGPEPPKFGVVRPPA